jgi:hypothetical protein
MFCISTVGEKDYDNEKHSGFANALWDFQASKECARPYYHSQEQLIVMKWRHLNA